MVEPWFQTWDGLWKSDIVAVHPSDGTTYIVDHTVVWETGDLVRHAADKEKYCTTPDIEGRVKALFPTVNDVWAHGVVIGAQGVWCHHNNQLCREAALPTMLKASRI